MPKGHSFTDIGHRDIEKGWGDWSVKRLSVTPSCKNISKRLSALLAAVTSHHAHRAGAHDGLHHLAGALELLEELVDLR